jgi:hypothetical protein
MPVQQLMRLITAYRLSQAIHVAATLGIAELLAGGPRTFDDLAVSTKGHAPSLYRLLRALASEGIFEELEGRRFANNAASELLRSDALTSVYGWAVLIGRPYFWQGWGNLLHSVQTGESGVRKVTGMDSWRYREQNPDEGAVFDRAMTDTTRALSAAIVEAYDFGQFKRIADIAGGHGAQLAAILARYPGTTGVLFDQPHVVAGATELLRDAGVGDRCEVVGGSFFETAPQPTPTCPVSCMTGTMTARSCGRSAAQHPWAPGYSSSSVSSGRRTRTPTRSSRTSTCWWAPVAKSACGRNLPSCLPPVAGGSSTRTTWDRGTSSRAC